MTALEPNSGPVASPESMGRFTGIGNHQVAVLSFVALVIVAGLIYRPWHVLPFDIWDFREFIPLLRDNHGPLQKFQAVSGHYAEDGRANLLFYLSFVVQWQVVGLEPAGWQWWRFVLMVIVCLLTFRFLRGLGFAAPGSAAGASLFLASTPVQRAWIQLMAEPQATALVLVAAILAIGYQGQEVAWGRRALTIALLLLGVMLSKEIIGVLCLPVLILALCRTEAGSWRPPRWTRRDRVLVALCALVSLAVGTLLLRVRSLPTADGYGMNYGTGIIDIWRMLENMVRATLPHSVAGDLRPGLIYPSNILFILVLALGCYHYARQSPGRSRWTAAVVVSCMGIPLLGSLAYLPWPKWDTFYGLPFLFGSAVLLAAAVQTLSATSRAHRYFAISAIILMVGYSAIAAHRSLVISEAILRLNLQVAHEIVAQRPGTTVVVVGPEDESRPLPVSGIELKEYAAAMGFADRHALPQVLEAGCTAVLPLLSGAVGPILMASFSYGCGRLPGAPRALRQDFEYRDWLTLGRRTGTLYVDLVPVTLDARP